QQVVPRDADVVHEDVEPALTEREGRLDHVLRLIVDRDVALDEGRLAATLLDEALRLLGGLRVSLVVDRDARAVARQTGGRGAADPAARPRAPRGSPFELDTHVPPKLAGTRLRTAAALLRLASNSWPASAERRLRNDAWDSVIGSPALFHSSGGRSSGFGTCDVRAAAMPALGGAEDQRGVVSAKAHRVGERRLDRPCTRV